MREKFTLTRRGWFNRAMLLFVLVCTSMMGRAAEPVDLGTLALDQEYEIKSDFKDYVGVFTAPKSGVLTASGTRTNWFTPFEDEAHTKQATYAFDFASGSWEMTVTEGQVVYLYGNFSMGSGTFKLTMPGEGGLVLEMNQTIPESGSVASVAGGGMVSAYFNANVLASGNAEVYIAGQKIGELGVRASGTILSVEIADLLVKAYDEGNAAEGDELIIKFSAVAKNDPNAKGDFEVKLVCPNKPVALVNETHIPASFLSYWITGNTDGILKLEFSDELLPEGGNAEIGYGDVEAENGYYLETVPYTVDGKTLSVDLTGKLRTPEIMLPLSTAAYDVITLKIKAVKDKQGNLVYSNNAGSLGSFFYNLAYKVLTADVDVEFTPANGTTLADVTEVKIWLRGESALAYDGVKFTYVDNGETKEVVVPNSEIRREDETDDEVELVVTVPAEVAGKKNIEVSLNNLQCADGKNHEISAKYDAFVVTVNSPVEDTMEVLADGTIINVTTNKPVGYMEYEVIDLNPEDPTQAIIKGFMWLTLQENGSWQSEVGGNYAMYRGHDYVLKFYAYATEADRNNGAAPVGTDEYIIHGAKLPYMNSSLTLVSMDPTPEDGLSSVDQNVITLTFDGLVKLEDETTFINEGMGMSSKFESIVPVDSYEGYANTWKLTVNKDALAKKDILDISFVAFDQDGNRLNGNEGRTGENAYFYYSYKCTFMTPDFTVVPADGAELTVLDRITVSYENGINPSWNGKACVYNQARDLVATVVDCVPVIPEGKEEDFDYQPVEQILTLDKAVDQNGSYYILFPANYFNLGSEYEQYNSKETIINFTINNTNVPGEGTNIVATAGDGKIILTFDEGVSAGVNYNCTEKILVKNAEGNVVLELTNGALDIDWELAWNQLVLKADITESGEYTIEFPAGLFFLDDSGTKESTAVVVTYVVEGAPVPEIADGTYYLKNVESGMFLTGGNAWGTQASLGVHGLDVVLTGLGDNKYSIDTNVPNSDTKHYLGSNGYVDSDVAEWTFVKVEDGVYNITLDGANYIGYDGETTVVALGLTDPTSAAAQWTLVTKDELLATLETATESNPVDATFLISGQNFNREDNNRNAAWQGGPAFGGDNTNFCAEKWNCTFNVYQTLTNIPNGIYEVSVQGFYRNGGYVEAAAAHNAGTEALNALLYANDVTAPLLSIFAESKEAAGNGWGTETEAGYIPNSMKDASAIFSAGAYADNKVQVVVTDGTLTIGVKKDAEVGNDWTIFDNFELTYLGEGPFMVNVLSPAETSLPQFPLNGTMVVETNHKDNVGYLVYEVRDLNPENPDAAIVRTQAILKQQEDGTWTYGFSGKFEPVFYEGHDYAVVFTAWASEMDYNYMAAPVGTAEHIIHGATPVYTYSEYDLVSITPDPNTTVLESVEQNVFTVTFNGPVKIDALIGTGMGTSEAFESVTPVDDEDGDGYAATWTLTVSQEWMKGLKYALNVTFWAQDATGARVKGNKSKDANTYFLYEYECNMNVPDFAVTPADGSTVEKLAEITVSFSNGINFSYQQAVGAAKVLDAEGNEVAAVASYKSVMGDDEENASSMVLTLDKEIVTAGNYTINFPAVYFYLGNQFDQYNSKATVVNVTVAPNVGIAGIVAEADNFTVYSVNGVLVLKNADKAELQNLPAGIYIVNGKKYIVK